MAIAILCFNCEGQTDFYKEVVNHSNETVKLFFGNSIIQQDTIVLQPNQGKRFLVGEQRGGNPNFNTCISSVDSVYVWVSGGKKLVKNIYDNSNWNLEGGRESRVPSFYSYNCVFFIEQADIN